MPFFKEARRPRFAAILTAPLVSRIHTPANGATPTRHKRVTCDGSLTLNYGMRSDDGLSAICLTCHKHVGLNSATVPPHLYSHTVRVPV